MIILDLFRDLWLWLQDVFRDVEACFLRNLSFKELLSMYWFLFFVEVPRYYLLELIIVLYMVLTYPIRKTKKDVARMKLFIERPLITILVPGKNEGKNIYKLVTSLREQTYQNYELIVVDDGSDDGTSYICSDLEKAGLIDRFLRAEKRGGKASAANLGLYYAKGKYIVHLDADSSLDRDAIENILLPFYLDPKVKGVGGTVKVRNSFVNLCTALQAIEYKNTIQVGRTVTSALGIYHIISGAFGAFERQTLINVGSWDIGPGLDGDVTQKLRKAGHRVVFATDAVCLTSVPTSWYRLYKQRLRWSRSLVRFRIRKHYDILLPNKNFSFFNFFSNFENIMYDCVFNYLWLFYVISLAFSHTDRLWEVVVISLLIRFFLSIIGFIVSLIISERSLEEAKLAIYLPFQTIYSGYFLRIVRLIGHTSEFFFFKSYHDSWNPRKTSILAQLEHQ